MGIFILKRLGVMLLTAFCLTFIVFYLTNLEPNLEKLAKEQNNMRMTDEQVATWLEGNGYAEPLLARYAQWVGILPGFFNEEAGIARCIPRGASPEIRAGMLADFAAEGSPRCGLLQGNLGTSTRFSKPVDEIIGLRLWLTGKLMFWVMIVMVPMALIIGVLAGMKEGSVQDRSLSGVSILTTSTPEYVSGVVLISLLATSFGVKIFKGTATSAETAITFENFTLPVVTMALYGMGYIARMTRASMAEVMTAQYIRTARLKGVSTRAVVLKHALRNALIAPFTVIMLQFPWLLTGVVIVESLFNYKGFGWTLYEAAINNDIDLLLSCSVVAVLVVLVTQLISDIGYVYLNPRIRVRA